MEVPQRKGDGEMGSQDEGSLRVSHLSCPFQYEKANRFHDDTSFSVLRKGDSVAGT